VPRLIHLNGPPGIGKSTLAQRYVDEHPGVLNLDPDQVRTLIGGWRQRFAETEDIVLPIALSMAVAHLRGGRDVVMPWVLCQLSDIGLFEAAAHDNGAVFCQVVLMDTKQRSVERCERRGEDGAEIWHQQVQEVANRMSGQALVADIHDRLVAAIAARSDTRVVPSIAGAIQQTYEAFTAVLDRSP
jgi:predicted ABC-type ATPase